MTVTAKDEYGKTGTASGTVTIYSPPAVNAGSAQSVNAESSLTFSQATETGGTAPFAYSWSFGDGTTATCSLNPAHRTRTRAVHGGCDGHRRQQADEHQLGGGDGQRRGPHGHPGRLNVGDGGDRQSFTAAATDVCPVVQAAGFTYAWTFGDGGTGTGATPSHTYATAGTYTVTVTAKDEYGKTGTATESMVVASSSAVLFHDTFSGTAPSSTWSFVSGTWQVSNGTLSQTSTTSGDPTKAMITNQTYPSNVMITAEVQVNSWMAGDTSRAGVGLYTNTSNGDGYNLIFHGTNQVQFLDDGNAWGNTYSFNWQVGTSYWFQLAEINGTLEGKVWAAGTAEPQTWMFQQAGWTDRTGGAHRSTVARDTPPTPSLTCR